MVKSADANADGAIWGDCQHLCGRGSETEQPSLVQELELSVERTVHQQKNNKKENE